MAAANDKAQMKIAADLWLDLVPTIRDDEKRFAIDRARFL
jgi:hypothetical protein